MTKQEQIEAKRIKPIEVGDKVLVEIPYSEKNEKVVGRGKKKETIIETTEKVFKFEGELIKIEGDAMHVIIYSTRIPSEVKHLVETYYPERYSTVGVVDRKFVYPTFHECGANNFCKEKRRINFYNQDLSSFLLKAGYGRHSDDFNKPQTQDEYEKVNFNPFIIDKDGVKHFYQRQFVWTLEQKQLLIESMYNEIEIGKFLFRYNSWERMQKEKDETGVGHSFDCVDGKQRFYAILEFLQDKYPDSHGFCWSDLSGTAQRRFLNFANLSYGEMPESATDEDVIDNFLTLNHTGVPMSKEHIAFVQSIRMK